MLSLRIWHYLAVLFVVVAMLGLNVKDLILNDGKWQQVSAQGLHIKMQTGLAQIYWQWQQAGRPNNIEYHPENVATGNYIALNVAGQPQIEQSVEGCKQMLNWFVDQKVLNNQVKVSTTIDRGVIAVDGFSCNFEYAGYMFTYNTFTSDLNFYDAE